MNAIIDVRKPFADGGVSAIAPLPREQIFRLVWPDPKSRVLGLPDGRPDADFWPMMGFEPDRQLGDKFWTLRDTTGELSDLPIQIEIMYRKAEDIAATLATPDSQGRAKANMGLVGKDTLEELRVIQSNTRKRINERLTLDVEEVMKADIARGAITLIVREGDNSIQSIRDLDGRDILTKYRGITEKFAKKVARQTGNDVQLGAIITRKGGHEMEAALDPDEAFLLSDFTQTGGSVKRAGLRVLGDPLWDRVRSGAMNFDARTPDELAALPFTLDVSYAVLSRPFQQGTPDQEKVAAVMTRRMQDVIRSLGRDPQLLPARAGRPAPRAREQEPYVAEIGHGHRGLHR